jgi:2'-5' RNA ligase
MRLFVALSISEAIREQLTILVSELRKLDSKPRWVNPAALHVTLKFIGNVSDDRLPEIDDALAAVAKPSLLRLEFRSLGFFPNDRRPSVMWVGIAVPHELTALAASIDASLVPCAVARETRPFAPHLTLARVREPRLSPALRTQADRLRDHSFGSQSVTSFQLMESKLKPTGAEYTTLRSYPFVSQGLGH